MCHEGTCTQCSQILPLYFLLLLCMTKIFEKKFHLISIWNHGGWKLWLKLFSFLLFFAFSNIFGILFKGLCYCIQLLQPIFPSTIIWNFSSYLTIKLLPFTYQHIFLSWWSIHMTPLLVWFSSLPVIISDYFSYVSRILHPLSPTRCISLFLIWNFIRWN